MKRFKVEVKQRPPRSANAAEVRTGCSCGCGNCAPPPQCDCESDSCDTILPQQPSHLRDGRVSSRR